MLSLTFTKQVNDLTVRIGALVAQIEASDAAISASTSKRISAFAAAYVAWRDPALAAALQWPWVSDAQEGMLAKWNTEVISLAALVQHDTGAPVLVVPPPPPKKGLLDRTKEGAILVILFGVAVWVVLKK